MLRIRTVIGIILSVIIVGILFINEVEVDTEVTRRQTKVGFVMNGSTQDKSWGQSHYEGMEKAADSLNLVVDYRENVPTDERCIPVIEELIADGCRIILCNSYEFGEYEFQVAKEHSDVYFFHATGIESGRNFASYFGRAYQMRYLSGIVAGMQTETNKIGYVAAFPISEVNRGINAFTLGVRKVNPDAVVYVSWSNSWIDDESAAATTYQLLEEYDIDVLTMHSDSLMPLEIAEEEGIWSIGYNMDNSAFYEESFLTAPIWNWERFYEPYILECLQHKFHGKNYWSGIDSGVAGLAPLSKNVKPGIAKVVEEERELLESETFDVFYGPIIDRDGVLRVPEGENMSDDTMLNHFDWYVEGVELYEE